MVVVLAQGCFYGETRASGATGNLLVVLKRHARGETTPVHGHAHPYLALVASGGFRQQGRGRENECIPGSLAVNTAGEEHCDRFEAELSEVINIELAPSWLEALRADGSCDPGFEWTTRQGLQDRARLLRGHLERPEPLSRFVVEGVAAELLGLAMRAPALTRRTRPPLWLAVIEEALREHFRRPPSLTALGQLVDRSPSQLVRAFRRWRGTSLGTHARRLRAEHARRAVLETSVSLLEIALESGYSDQSHMTRELRAFLGCTPARLRRARARRG